ncbi:amidohydrolase [Polymorphobacter sp. PAMC 29334]|uniref:amidohydrolase family protein n=1 Tax=Polymorphobacter sp. PAMC 29334 TaxID=2862331 RepID=UPI001C67E4D1|nr:amidohydrolase family protein [Polymorphobacter sp. PAMC 29334]QYE36360.1 amidohydrolase [Polymorphobacter sp. PAMC 29334]
MVDLDRKQRSQSGISADYATFDLTFSNNWVKPMPDQARIDVHHHILPPPYRKWLMDHGITTAGGPPLPEWSVSATLEFMAKSQIATGILSVSMPGVHLGDDHDARRMARICNDFTADVVSRHAGRFGFFAVLPLPDLDGAMAEVAHAFDDLHADGVVLLANARGTYLGDPAWDTLMDELNRRKAVIFEHPADLPGPPVQGIPSFAVDFLLDTARAAISLALNGCLERYPDLKIILSHAGGFIPFAAERIAVAISPDQTIESGVARLQRFHFDTALSGTPWALPSLLAFADPAKIVFGTDWPFASEEQALHFTKLTDAFSMPDDVRRKIARGNAEALFPRLAPPAVAKRDAM